MRRYTGYLLPLAFFLVSLALGMRALQGAGVFDAQPASCALGSSCNPIQHIIIMDKENRSFDSMFGTFPGADGATTFIGPDGLTYPLVHQPVQLPLDIDHSPGAAHTALDRGKMDGFPLEAGAIQGGVDMADSQFYQSDIPSYWKYASAFTLDD